MLNIPSVPSQAGTLQEPVSLVIIDTNIHGQDVSRVSLQFTLEFRDVITVTNESCAVPGYCPVSITTINGAIIPMSVQANYRNSFFYDERVGRYLHLKTCSRFVVLKCHCRRQRTIRSNLLPIRCMILDRKIFSALPFRY